MADQFYRVVPPELNLRSAPKVEPRTVLARLQQGQQVRKLAPAKASPKGWYFVQADLQGTVVEGFVKASYLQKVTSSVPVPSPPVVLPNIPEARLPSTGPVRRNQSGDGPRVFDLTEANAPGRPGPTPTGRSSSAPSWRTWA